MRARKSGQMGVRMNYQTAFCWEKGRGRKESFRERENRPERTKDRNGDSLLLQQIQTRRGRMLLAVVSDGISGLEEGENASGFLVGELKRWFYGDALEIAGKSCLRKRGLIRMEKSLARRIYNAAGSLRAYGARENRRLGATLSAVLLWKRRYLICSVGDSRIYLIGRRENRVLTWDDTDRNGRLTRCIGFMGWYPMQSIKGRLGRGKLLLLCTDGFWRKLQDEEQEAARKTGGEGEMEMWLERMCVKLRSRGERDDITAILIRIK